MTPTAIRRPTLLDVGEGVALTLAVVMVAALPPISTELAVPQPVVAATVGVALVGAIGLVACFVAGSFRSPRVLPAGLILSAGVAVWIVAVVLVGPQVGWRVGLASAWLLAALAFGAAWFVLREYPARVYPALVLLGVGAVLASLAPTFPMVLAALSGGAAATFVVALLVLRASAPGRQSSAAL